MPRRTYDPANGRPRPTRNDGTALKRLAEEMTRAAHWRRGTNTEENPR